MTNREHEASIYNMGTKDLLELKKWKYGAFNSLSKSD